MYSVILKNNKMAFVEYKSMYRINLYDNRTEILLNEGSYNLYFTGGFNLELLRDFQITLQNMQSRELVKLNKTRRIRSYENGQKAIKYWNFEIKLKGNYEVLILNPDQVRMKKSMLTSLNWIMSPPKKNDKNIIISKNGY
jgi:hypothetical protein